MEKNLVVYYKIELVISIFIDSNAKEILLAKKYFLQFSTIGVYPSEIELEKKLRSCHCASSWEG